MESTPSATPSGQFETWVRAARLGSAEALGQLLEVCQPYLLLVAERELGQDLRAKGGASDLVQDTFLEAHLDFARFQGNNEKDLHAWLRRILLNNILNFSRQFRETQLRHVAREVSLDDRRTNTRLRDGLSMDTPSPSGHAISREQQEKLQEALRRLPQHYEKVLLLRHEQGLTFSQIGREMNRSEDGARKLWGRALQALNEVIRSMPGWDNGEQQQS